MSQTSMDPRWQHPFTGIVAGPTGCGKTQLVLSMTQEADELIVPPPQNILWVHDDYQDVFDTVKDRITFSNSLSDIDELPRSMRHLVVIDDMMTEGAEKVLQLFTKGSHHRNMSVIYIVQNLFDQNKHHRTISLNTHYLVLFKNPRDNTQIKTLAGQMHPGKAHLVVDAFTDATSKPYGYLLMDFRQNTREELRLRTNFLPSDDVQYVYLIEPVEEEPVEV